MRKLLLSISFIFSVLFVYGTNVKPDLKEVTIYYSGAELTHSAIVTLAKGDNVVMLEGLTPNIDINSLKINVNNSVVVASSEFTNDYLTEKVLSDKVKKLKDSIEICQEQIYKLSASIKINTASLDLLKKGIESNLSGSVQGNSTAVKKQLTTAEISQNLDFFTSKASSLEKEIYKDNQNKDIYSKKLNRLKRQLNQEEQNKGVFSGILKLSLMASYTTKANITVTYFTSKAGWTPFYDMIISDTSKPVRLKGKSKIRQTTGIDWDKVNITLSTSTPSKTKEAPLFSTWFLDFMEKYGMGYRSKDKRLYAAQNMISYEVSSENEMRKEDTNGGAGGGGVMYIVDGQPYGDISDIDPNMIASYSVLDDDSAKEQYGLRSAGKVVVITTKKMTDYIAVTEKNTSMEYKIDLPYSIPGNGKEQIVELKDYNISADYKYYSAPKLDAKAFLIAEFKDWEKLNILSGIANITYDGTYVGQTYLNTSQTNNNLSVTLDSDKRVIVKREKLTDYSQVKTFGSDVKITLAYKITVKNNRNKSINFTLKEQYPISSNKEIKVELIDKQTTTPTFNKEDIGVLTWDFAINAGESKEFTIAYYVKYPKDKDINLK